jgi:radical SAM protein with 4Fe4S-binding SPASM domain
MTEGQNFKEATPLRNLHLYLTGGSSLTCPPCAPARSIAPANTVAPATPVAPATNVAPVLPLETVLGAVREALPLGLRLVRLCGGGAPGGASYANPTGETLLHPGFDQLIERLERQELGVVVETSGAGLTPARAARLARMPQCRVTLGLSGADAATHDALFGQPGAFQTTVRAARLLAQNGLAPQFVFSVVRENAGQLSAVARLAGELGASALRIIPMRPVMVLPAQRPALARPKVRPAYRLATNELARTIRAAGRAHLASTRTPLAVEELIALGRRVERDISGSTRLRLVLDQPPVFRGLVHMGHIVRHGRCNALDTLSLQVSGSYALCGGVTPTADLRLGQAGEDALEDIWRDHPVLRELRGGMPDRLEGVCSHCVLNAMCQGYCVVENYQRTGSFWSPYWFCEEAERVGLFPAGRIIENRI